MIDNDRFRKGRRTLEDGAFIVIDMGKTLAKVSLWDRAGRRLDVRTRPNAAAGGVLDVNGISAWLVEALGAFAGHPVEAIVPVGHGAGVAALKDGALAFAPTDYEAEIPAEVMERYRAVRDPFAVTGSPALPHGLNLGAQVWWLAEQGLLEGTMLLPWAQYWAWFLTGAAVSEVSSLGCHTDLWAPAEATFSPLAARMGWAERFAPVVHAGAVAGTLKPEIAAATGLSPAVRVLAGVHDSNAALHAARGFADVADRDATVLSTGTWFVAMRRAQGDAPVLPEGRDCLVNVDVDGCAVPSARFMGGREIEIAAQGARVDDPAEQAGLLAQVPALLASGTMLVPTLAPGCGPYPDGAARWIGEPGDGRAAACLYAALMADAALGLIGARDVLLVEGRFAAAEVFVRALAGLRPDSQVMVADGPCDAAFGALRLIDPGLVPAASLRQVEPLAGDWEAYRARWLQETTS